MSTEEAETNCLCFHQTYFQHERARMATGFPIGNAISKSLNVFDMGRDVLRGLVRYKRLRGAPIIIGGCERSGTTLLHRILSAHPDILAIPEETWALCHSDAAGFRNSHPVQRWRLLRHLGKIPHGHFQGKQPSRWSEKSPANIYYFRDIRNTLGADIKLIQIVRDGRDVVTSMHQDKTSEPWVSPGRWISSVTAGLQYLEDPRVLTTRYEDIVLDFGKELGRICAFLGYGSVPRQVTEWTHYTPIRNHHSGAIKAVAVESIGKWKKGSKWEGRVKELVESEAALSLLQKYRYV